MLLTKHTYGDSDIGVSHLVIDFHTWSLHYTRLSFLYYKVLVRILTCVKEPNVYKVVLKEVIKRMTVIFENV